jgi:hypothetical protein
MIKFLMLVVPRLWIFNGVIATPRLVACLYVLENPPSPCLIIVSNARLALVMSVIICKSSVNHMLSPLENWLAVSGWKEGGFSLIAVIYMNRCQCQELTTYPSQEYTYPF